MIFTPENTKGKTSEVFDALGRQIKGVIEFNSKTYEIKFIPLCSFAMPEGTGPFPVMKSNIHNVNDINMTIANMTVPGAYIKLDGVKYEGD